jgi:hypothetical protein
MRIREKPDDPEKEGDLWEWWKSPSQLRIHRKFGTLVQQAYARDADGVERASMKRGDDPPFTLNPVADAAEIANLRDALDTRQLLLLQFGSARLRTLGKVPLTFQEITADATATTMRSTKNVMFWCYMVERYESASNERVYLYFNAAGNGELVAADLLSFSGVPKEGDASSGGRTAVYVRLHFYDYGYPKTPLYEETDKGRALAASQKQDLKLPLRTDAWVLSAPPTPRQPSPSKREFFTATMRAFEKNMAYASSYFETIKR